MLLSLSSIGIWAQGPYYKFTSSAVGNLFTADNEESMATIAIGELCNRNYYIKSGYASTTAPNKVETKAFNSIEYYILNDGVYFCADGEAYDEGKTYYKAEAVQITETNKGNYVGDVGKFSKTAENAKLNIAKEENGGWVASGVEVKEGDVCDDDTYYYLNNGGVKGSALKTSSWSWLNYVSIETGFKLKDGIYTLNAENVYTPITSTAYDSGKTYYAVTFNSSSVEDAALATSYAVSGLEADAEIYYYDSSTSTYKKVQNGDKYLGDDAYFTPSSSFALRTPAELAALGYARSVAGLITKEVDGKTLTVVCSGDVCTPDETFATTGYKFQINANNVIFKDQEGTSVAAGSIYVDGNAYYTRAQKYAEVQEIPTTTKYQLAQFVYVNNAGRYDVVNSGTDINDITYYINSNAGEEFSGEIAKTEVYKFNDSAKGWIYIDNGFNNISEINVGDVLDSEKAYVVARTQWQPWSGNYDGVEFEALKNGDYAITSYVVDDEQGLYTKDGSSYVPAAGTIYDEGKTYYSGVTFSEIENIKENEEYATPVTSVNPGSTEYFVRTGEESNYTYTPVYSGTNYDASATYCIKDGFDYSTIDLAALQSGNYVQSETVASNYWEALVNEINANEYETVVFKTAEGEPTATICNHITQAMMHTTTVKALDYENVQIDKIEGASSNGSDLNPNGTFIYGPGDYTENSTITILLLPQIKDANSVGHKHVPSYCAYKLPQLELIVMPDNATCIEHDAFSNKATINQVILNDGLKMIGHDAFSVARLNVLTIPETVEYIGTRAFGTNQGGGYLHDVYFLGKEAPIVEMDAFGSKAYVNNNAYLRPSENNYNSKDKYDPMTYRLDRSHYVYGDYMMAMLHLRTDLTPEERAAFTDITRDFHVFDLKLKNGNELVDVEEASEFKSNSTLVESIYMDRNNGFDNYSVSVYWNGNKEDASFSTLSDGVSLSTENKFELPQYNSEAQWENVTGYYDNIVGHNYKWPGQAGYSRSYTLATNNLTWDGLTSIAEYANAEETSYDTDCDGIKEKTFAAGEQYIGLHQFVLVTGDVSPNTTPQEWEFSTIGGKNWWSICVPVNMTVAEVRDAFGENTQVCKFDHVTREPGEMVKFYFTDEQCYGKGLDETAIKANYPYMIHPSSKKGDGVEEGTSKFTLPRYELSGSQIPVVIEKTAKNGGVDTEYTYKFIGQYNTNADGTPLYMPQYSYFLGNAGNDVHRFFFQTGTTGKWKPFTCVIIPSDGKADYVDFFGGSSESKVRVASSVFGLDEYDEATSISNYEIVCGAENNIDNAKVYNLNGQLVGKSLNGLSRGVYIVNGQKYIVR